MINSAMTDAGDPDLAPQKKAWTPFDFLGLAAGLVPFALPYSESKTDYATETPHGLEVGTRTTKHMDYMALGGGGVAVVCAFVGLFLLARLKWRGFRLALFAVLLALGGFQILRGALVEQGTSESGVLLR